MHNIALYFKIRKDVILWIFMVLITNVTSIIFGLILITNNI